MEKIDFVITWLDSNDIEWQKEKNKYNDENDKIDVSNARYRDWEFLKYWFRAVEENASWVNKIYFVTYGHLPKWLNVNNEKLVIVNHKDIIDKKNLPTFNSCAIEANLYKIKGLSEYFVYFNDDMFVNDKTSINDFFKNNLPMESAILTPVHASKEVSSCIHYNCMKVINENFDFKNLDKKKLFSLKNGKYLYKNLTLSVYPFNVGLRFHHLPTSFLKSTFSEVWDKEKELMELVSGNKFRKENDVSQWLFQFWQIASNKFEVRKERFGKYYDLSSDFDSIISEIKNMNHKLICLNDSNNIENFDQKKDALIKAFENRYPNKSKYEI